VTDWVPTLLKRTQGLAVGCSLSQPGTLTVNKARCPLSCIRRSKAFDQETLLFSEVSARIDSG